MIASGIFSPELIFKEIGEIAYGEVFGAQRFSINKRIEEVLDCFWSELVDVLIFCEEPVIIEIDEMGVQDRQEGRDGNSDNQDCVE